MKAKSLDGWITEQVGQTSSFKISTQNLDDILLHKHCKNKGLKTIVVRGPSCTGMANSVTHF